MFVKTDDHSATLFRWPLCCLDTQKESHESPKVNKKYIMRRLYFHLSSTGWINCEIMASRPIQKTRSQLSCCVCNLKTYNICRVVWVRNIHMYAGFISISVCTIMRGIILFGLNNEQVNSYSASRDNWCTGTPWKRIITAQCEGMGEVLSARYEPALLPPCPSIRALCYSNCQRSTQSHQQSKG